MSNSIQNDINYVQERDRIVAIDPRTQAEIGELTLTRLGDDLASFDHTIVQPSYEGQGIAGELLAKAVELMRQEKRKVVSRCSYVTAVFARKRDYDDVNADCP